MLARARCIAKCASYFITALAHRLTHAPKIAGALRDWVRIESVVLRSLSLTLWFAVLLCSVHVFHAGARAQVAPEPVAVAPEEPQPAPDPGEEPTQSAAAVAQGDASETIAPGAQVSDAAQAAKLAELETLLAEDERMTLRWWRFFTLVQAGLIVAQTTVGYFAFDDPDQHGMRVSAFLNAGASGLGLLSLVVMRPPALSATKRVLSLPGATPEQRAAKLRAAEELVEESGEAQELGTGWLPYTGGVVVGAAIGLPLWLKYDQPVEAAMSFFGSIAFTVVQTLTTPTRARDYRGRRQVEMSLGLGFGGASLSGRF